MKRSTINKSHAPLNIVGPNIRRLRCIRGWTQFEFAMRLNLAGYSASRCHVSKNESQLIYVDDESLYYIAKALRVTLPELFPSIMSGRIVRKRIVRLPPKRPGGAPPRPIKPIFHRVGPKWARWRGKLFQDITAVRKLVRHYIERLPIIPPAWRRRQVRSAPVPRQPIVRGEINGAGVAQTGGTQFRSEDKRNT